MDTQQYHKEYQKSITAPEAFWDIQAKKFLSWHKPWTQVLTGNFQDCNVEWFIEGKLNACYNCLDRHLPHHGDEIALIFEGNEPGESKTYTYQALHREVCLFANTLKKFNVHKGDRVVIYLPMIPEALIAMLACARIGAIHSVIFSGFSPDSIYDRVQELQCKLIITANEGLHGRKKIPLKENIDEALLNCDFLKNVIVVKRTETSVPFDPERDHWYHEIMQESSPACTYEIMDAQDPLFILYTSGSTGKPKGVVHATGGYLVYASMTFSTVFDYTPGEIFWCTGDIGWITGHSYNVYGPLANRATIIFFEGVPHYPAMNRYWEIIDKYHVNIFYTSPTAIRALRQAGDEWLNTSKRDSLRLLGTVGEPINPDVWQWYYDVIGKGKCPIIDTWWQTETGGIMISPIPGATPLKPGAASWPFFGITPEIIDDQDHPTARHRMGKLMIRSPWPGMMKTIYQNPARFEAYFSAYPGFYSTSDDALLDEDSYYWILGRNDDVINVSGHRLGSAEIENALLAHPIVAEAGVVSVPHDIKGEGIYAFITLKTGFIPSDAYKQQLINTVRHHIGAIATIDHIQWAKALPKTRSGKIMRRLLRKIANEQYNELGDLTTLDDPAIVQDLIEKKKFP